MESTDVINEIRGILPRNSIGKYDLLKKILNQNFGWR
jgi:hypothetical protein